MGGLLSCCVLRKREKIRRERERERNEEIMDYSDDPHYFDDDGEGVFIDPETYEKLREESIKKLAEIDKAFSKYRPEQIRPSSCESEADVNVEFNRKLYRDLAFRALHYYNFKEGADFELVEIKDRVCGLLPRYSVFHITFEAKHKYCADSRPQLFFAEAYQFHEKRYDFAMKFCVMLDPYSPDVIKGCSLCKDLLHPKGYKFLRGPEDFHQPYFGFVGSSRGLGSVVQNDGLGSIVLNDRPGLNSIVVD